MKQSPTLESIAVQLQSVLFEKENEAKTGFREILEQISKADSVLYEHFLRFVNAYQAWIFIKQDIELRSKVKDIWQMQCDRSRSESIDSLEHLKTYCSSKELHISWPDLTE